MRWVILNGDIADFLESMNPFDYFLTNIANDDDVAVLLCELPALLHAQLLLLFGSLEDVCEYGRFVRLGKVNKLLVFIAQSLDSFIP